MTFSPILITNPLPDLIFCCNRIGSNAGSNSSPMFSKSTHFPNWIANSKLLSKLPSDNLNTSSYTAVSGLVPRFLTNLLAWVYGSIMRGHLLDLNMIIPFSIERLSLGRPATVHILIITSSPNTFLIDTWLVCLIPSLLMWLLHSSSSSSLYWAVKGPAYDTIPAAIKQSPTSKVYLSPRVLTVSVHLTFSPSSPLIIFSALINFLPQSSISAWSDFSVLISSSICLCKLSSFSLISFTFCLFSLRFD